MDIVLDAIEKQIDLTSRATAQRTLDEAAHECRKNAARLDEAAVGWRLKAANSAIPSVAENFMRQGSLCAQDAETYRGRAAAYTSQAERLNTVSA